MSNFCLFEWGEKDNQLRKNGNFYIFLIYNEHFQGIRMNIIKHFGRHIVLSAFFFLVMAGGSVTAQADDGTIAASGVAASEPGKGVYALVNGTPITYLEYNAELTTLLKQRYYHGRVSEAKAEGVRKELTDRMIDRVLMLQDAEQRGIKPDEKKVEEIIANLDRHGKLKGNNRDKLISQVRDIEGKRSQINQLKELVRNVPPPTPEEVRAYYDQHLDLFTEPEKMRLSVILVSVDPSSPPGVWAARQVSGDKSAAKGGDLGYLHHGMLPRGLEDKVDKFKVGEVVEPIKLLEGMAVFRLEDRIPAIVIPFDRSKDRAEQLLIRDNQDHAWQENIDRLRKTAKIEIFDKVAY
jgi:parvulin-like peptidyl-prolyl isomerase